MEATVRFFDGKGAIAGTGVRVQSGEIFTTASVVEAAAGRHFQRVGHADLRFEVDFPLAGNRDRFEAVLVRWPKGARTKPDDVIATLRLSTDANLPATFLDVTAEVTIGGAVSSVIYPADAPEGTPVQGELEGYPARPRVSLPRLDNTAGAPLWNEAEQLVGMVLGRAPGGWDRHVAPVAAFAGHRFTLDRVGGSPVRLFDFAVKDAPQALVADLFRLERDGLEPDQCEVVQVALDQLATKLDRADRELPYARRPSMAARELHKTYVTWNGGKKGPAGAPHRQHHLVLVRENANRLGRLRGSYDGSVFEELSEGVQQVMTRFADLPLITNEAGGSQFPAVLKMMANYRSQV